MAFSARPRASSTRSEKRTRVPGGKIVRESIGDGRILLRRWEINGGNRNGLRGYQPESSGRILPYT